MSSHLRQFGAEIAPQLPDISPGDAYTSRNFASVQDLLDRVKANPPMTYPMLRSTSAKLAQFYGKPCSEITLEAVDADRPEFRDYLRECKYASTSINTYSYHSRLLITIAAELGWQPKTQVMPIEWLPLQNRIKKFEGGNLLRYLIRLGRTPTTTCEDDLENFVRSRIVGGGSYSRAYQLVTTMRRLLVKAGFDSGLRLDRVAKDPYGVSVQSFPEPLRSQVADARLFKESRYARNRTKPPVRPITSRALDAAFSYLYGYAINIAGITGIDSLEQLVTESICERYAQWALDDRELQGNTVSSQLGMICAALGQNPKYAYISGSWLPNLVKSIPDDSEEMIRRRKEAKFLPYETLAAIPEMIRRDRPKGSKADAREIAISVRNELLMKWPTVLPWRQANLRNMRISGEQPNLFKAPFPKFSSMTKPGWLAEAEKVNPDAEVWQIYFSKKETKTKIEVNAVLPRCLVGLLEEYLIFHRSHLVRGRDPGTLFLNEHGGPLASRTVEDLVAKLTLRYGGRIVTPHLYRDIFAYMYLDKAPEDYLTLSKLLWHSNINTTIRIYGRRFNESAALCRMESVLGM